MPCAECGNAKVVGRGLCRKHYQRAWKLNDFGGLKTRSEKTPLKKRLLSKVKVCPNGCWEWTGHRRSEGDLPYGLVWLGGKTQRAHRVSYELHKGKIPDGLSVLHKCDNPPCINPAHLFLGTRGENCGDAGAKNRFPLNDQHWNTKLSIVDVYQIRMSTLSQASLADTYKVSQGTISRIKSGLRRAKA